MSWTDNSLYRECIFFFLHSMGTIRQEGDFQILFKIKKQFKSLMTKAMYTFTQPYKPTFKTWSHRNAN